MLNLAIFFIVSDPPLLHQLRHEIDATFPNPQGPLDVKLLSSIPLLDAIIHETLRLGSNWFFPRVVGSGGVVIDNKFIPEGNIVALASYSQHISESNVYP